MEYKLKCVLGKTDELAGPHFDRVIVVHDGIIRFEATTVEVCHLVDARIVVMGIVWSRIIQKVMGIQSGCHELLPATPTPGFPAVMWFHMVSSQNVNDFIRVRRRLLGFTNPR